MESQINADQNFYSRRQPRDIEQNPLPHQQLLPHNQTRQLAYDPPPLPDFQSRTPQPQLPPKLPFLTTANLQTVTSNGYASSGLTDGGDPAAFYRDYRGVQQSGDGYTDVTNGMTAITSESRPLPSSLRSNGNGSTAKHPVVPPRKQASYRSASSPLDDRMALSSMKANPVINGVPTGQQPSVKDLLKRFDSNNEQSSSATRRPSPRVANKEIVNGRAHSRDQPGYMTRTANSAHHSSNGPVPGNSTRQNGAGRTSPEKSRTTQRARFASEDQQSNNTLSSAARSTRPRNSPAGPHPSKSMMNLSPTSPTSIPSPQNQTPSRKPLFGEVVPLGLGTDRAEGIAYGIPHSATRRTSDSGLHPTWNNHNRSRSDVDISPSSPTAWYLGVTPALDDVDHDHSTRSSPGHNRNHSDFADTKVNTMNGVSPSFEPSTPAPPQPTTKRSLPAQKSSVSRLPVSSKRLSNSSESSSPASRAVSPYAVKPLSNGKARKPEQRPWSPATHVNPPSSRNITPTQKTARSTGRGRKVEPANSGRLNAYISAPPPKTSPPLRSSRPRQTVSSASTPERSNGVGPSTSHQARTGMTHTRNGGFEDPRPRNIVDTGPVNYAERRAKIQRAYTKSIHENEQKEIRAANMRRLSERHARDSLSLENQQKESSGTTPEASPPPATIKEDSQAELGPPALHISTDFEKPKPEPVAAQSTSFLVDDSPTLGMPGTYVEEEEPASAISCATGITEIDNEPQTEGPLLAHMSSVKSPHTRQGSNLSSNVIFTADELSPEQAMFGFHTEHQGSIDIMLASTPVQDTSRESNLLAAGPSCESDNHDHQLLTSDVYTASPIEAASEDSRPPTSFDTRSEQGDLNAEGTLLSGGRFNGSTRNSYQDTQEFVSEPEFTVSPDTPDGAHLQLPSLRTALGPPSVAVSEPEHDYLNTPVTDMEDEGSVGPSASRRQSTYDPYDAHNDAPMQINRRSHQSNWTDYSLDSAMVYSRSASVVGASDPENRPTPPPREPHSRSASPTPPVPPKPAGYSPLASPNTMSNSPRIPSPVRRLPSLSTGDGFAASLLNNQNRLSATSGPLLPDYSPPLPLVPATDDDSTLAAPTRTPPLPGFQTPQRPASSAYQSSQTEANGTPEPRAGSDHLESGQASISTPRSSTQISFEDVVAAHTFAPKPTEPQTEEERMAAAKQMKRLIRRKMVIKEVIDTESLYLKDMNVVEEIYKGTAEACPKLDTGDIKTIFRNTDDLIAFTTVLLDDLKSATAPVYSPRVQKKSRESRATTVTSSSNHTGSISPNTESRFSMATALNDEHLTEFQKDQKTHIGASFNKHLRQMETVYTDYLKNSEIASARLAALAIDPSVKVWLGECDIVAKDLTQAWDIDALLVKPVQRITRYQLLFKELLEVTEHDHPDYEAIQIAAREVIAVLNRIDDLKRRLATVENIMKGRKRKESDVRTGLAKAFGRNREKAAERLPTTRIQDDEHYFKLHEKYNDDYLRLQVFLRDVEFYTRQSNTYVDGFLKLLSAMELVMRLSGSPWPEIESKWARFNMSMRDMGTVVLEEHIGAIKTRIIEPIVKVIELYGPPGLAMKKRAKRRIDYEKLTASRGSGTKLNEKDTEKIEQYKALNETLKIELPRLSAATEKLGNICLGNFVMIQSQWYSIWQTKVKTVLEENRIPENISEIVSMFNRDYKFAEGQAQDIGIVNGNFNGCDKVMSASRSSDTESKKGRPSNLSTRSRGHSVTSDKTPPSLPTPDFARGPGFVMSPLDPPAIRPQFTYSTTAPHSAGHSRAGSGSPAASENPSQQRPPASSLARPSTGRSYTSDSGLRGSHDYNTPLRRESGSTYNSAYHVDGPPVSSRPFSGIFHSAMPLPDGPEDSARSSRNSSRDRNISGGYNVLYLAASLFEFNIGATKSEAGYPYLTYQAGEIFDVIGEKGELWLAKNQDDASEQVGWIWSKHFARLATD
ncbi:RhoGEF protein-like protein [Amylocarpus encephaloides]|uniref:RhoGEF protein-like protein n=1 Tax=Amylocarpus encephaloides TaxID=45428 RepID=A0A9P7YDA9_9HELO|nr:RhoGEF protein-like protein [Amylocarpus encephaloides]